MLAKLLQWSLKRMRFLCFGRRSGWREIIEESETDTTSSTIIELTQNKRRIVVFKNPIQSMKMNVINGFILILATAHFAQTYGIDRIYSRAKIQGKRFI